MTHGHHAWVAGTATREGVSIAFAGGLDIDASGTLRRVDGSRHFIMSDQPEAFAALVDAFLAE